MTSFGIIELIVMKGSMIVLGVMYKKRYKLCNTVYRKQNKKLLSNMNLEIDF